MGIVMKLANGELQFFRENLTSQHSFLLCLFIEICLFLWMVGQDVGLNGTVFHVSGKRICVCLPKH